MKRKTLWILNAILISLSFVLTVLDIISKESPRWYIIAKSIVAVCFLLSAICIWTAIFMYEAEDDEYDEEDDDDESEEE